MYCHGTMKAQMSKVARRLIVIGSRESAWTRKQKWMVVQCIVHRLPEIKERFDSTGSGRSDKGGVDIWFEKLMEIFAEVNFKAFPPVGEKPQCYYDRNKRMADWGTEFWGFLPINHSLKRSGTMQTIRMADKQDKVTHVYIVSDTGYFETKSRGFYEVE